VDYGQEMFLGCLTGLTTYRCSLVLDEMTGTRYEQEMQEFG